MSKYIAYIAASAALAMSPYNPAHAAKEPLQLDPSSKWNINYSDEKCTLVRSFGQNENMINLYITRYAPGNALDIFFVGELFKSNFSQGTTMIKFGDHQAEQELGYFSAKSSDDIPSMVFRSSMTYAPFSEESSKTAIFDPTISDQENGIEYIKTTTPKKKDVIIKTGSLGKAMAAMRSCTDDLITSWGIDAKINATLTRLAEPTTSPATWIRSSDYPSSQLRSGAQTIVRFRLNIDEVGHITQCRIQDSYGDDAFDSAVCDNIMKRAKFNPALDKDNNPVASYYVNKVIFRVNQ